MVVDEKNRRAKDFGLDDDDKTLRKSSAQGTDLAGIDI